MAKAEQRVADGFDLPQPGRLGQLPEVTTAALTKFQQGKGDRNSDSSLFKESSQQTSAQTKGNAHKNVSSDTADFTGCGSPAIIQLLKL